MSSLRLLYTTKNVDGSYSWRCCECGWKGKFTYDPEECPNCTQLPNKVMSEWVMKKGEGNIPNIHCPRCKTKMAETPRTGHPNSNLWVNQVFLKEVLLSCPNMCTANHIGMVMRKR